MLTRNRQNGRESAYHPCKFPSQPEQRSSELVDVFEQPLRALADGVLVTPSLAKVSPAPVANVVGNLSDKRNVLLMLGVEGNVS